jgi:hypothetical protein
MFGGPVTKGSVNGSSDEEEEEGDPLELPSLDFLNSDDEKVYIFSVFFFQICSFLFFWEEEEEEEE